MQLAQSVSVLGMRYVNRGFAVFLLPGFDAPVGFSALSLKVSNGFPANMHYAIASRSISFIRLPKIGGLDSIFGCSDTLRGL